MTRRRHVRTVRVAFTLHKYSKL